jgi:meiotically up-regulated gene 157 (Mug157) protein
MTHRRRFLTCCTAPLAAAVLPWMPASAAPAFVSRRPPPAQRRFASAAVERAIVDGKARIGKPELAWLFENCFPNTLDTTVTTALRDGRPDTYVITGDIDAMWLRDSSAQVWPYLPLMKDDAPLRALVAGVVRRHARCVLIDPYANAFYDDPAKVSEHSGDKTRMKPGVHERKWELDSLCYVIRLAHGYWRHSGDLAPFDAEWRAAMALVVATMRDQQRRDGSGAYRFKRTTDRPFDTAAGDGTGWPAAPVGLVASVFRPSDDGSVLPYLIPSNYFAATSLRQLARLLDAVGGAAALRDESLALAGEIEAALKAHAAVERRGFGRVLAYEVDGYGSHYLTDDSNIPSLISLPYLGAIAADDPLYRATRRFLFTEGAHPYYVRGRAAEGTTGPHAGRDMIWPMGIIVRAMTSSADGEIRQCLSMLVSTHAGTGFMHEAFHKDDPATFTRAWFAWANTLFGELVMKLLAERPHLLA